MNKSKYAFTMIELIFVIVVLGILSAVAIPKMAATRDDAQITKGRSDIASIRSAIISERQTRLIKGDSSWINSLSSGTTTLFDGNGTTSNDVGLLMYGITSGTTDGHWSVPSGDTFPFVRYTYKVLGTDNTFDYNVTTGIFDCTQGTSAPSCDQLTN